MTSSNLLTVRELADYLHVHQTTIYRLLKRKRIPHFRVGSDYRFHADQIVEWCKLLQHQEGR